VIHIKWKRSKKKKKKKKEEEGEILKDFFKKFAR
jgi:hypothetical protein